MSDRYPSWPKIPRLDKDAVITEKIDGTNGLVSITQETFGTGVDVAPGVNVVSPPGTPCGEDGLPLLEYHVRAGSRNRWLTPGRDDNAGFAGWVRDNCVSLAGLGAGQHYGEWFGNGIQRGYNLAEKYFALFNAGRWYDGTDDDEAVSFIHGYFPKAQPCPPVCAVVPILWVGSGLDVKAAVDFLTASMHNRYSVISPNFRNPEGLIVFRSGAAMYEKHIFGSDTPKGATK